MNTQQALYFNYKGMEYWYIYDWEDLQMFHGVNAQLLTYCVDDVQYCNGHNADMKEVIA